MKTLHVKVELLEEMLGMSSSSPDIHEQFIASKAPDALSREEEIASLGSESVIEKGRTVFPKIDDGTPFLWDYQLKGAMKDNCSALRRVGGTESSKLKAFKKVIDGNIFVKPRKIPIIVNGDMGNCQRPLRASTAQGDRVALADSETVPEGSTFEFDVLILNDKDEAFVREWFDYSELRGFGQWRSSGKGRALSTVTDVTEQVA